MLLMDDIFSAESFFTSLEILCLLLKQNKLNTVKLKQKLTSSYYFKANNQDKTK